MRRAGGMVDLIAVIFSGFVAGTALLAGGLEAAASAEDTSPKQLGDQFRVGDFTYRITGVRTTKVFRNEFQTESAGPNATFLIVFYEITNEGKETHTGLADDFELLDTQGHKFQTSANGTTAFLMTGGDKEFLLTQLQPGITKAAAQVFEVPEASLPGIRLRIPEKGFWGTKEAFVVFTTREDTAEHATREPKPARFDCIGSKTPPYYEDFPDDPGHEAFKKCYEQWHANQRSPEPDSPTRTISPPTQSDSSKPSERADLTHEQSPPAEPPSAEGLRSLPDGLPFRIGASRDEVRRRLGPPSFEKEFGYWANTTVDRFDNVVPNWLTLSYLYDARTHRVRQTEASFATWTGLDTVSKAVSRMAARSVGSDARRALAAVGEQGVRQAQFKVGSLEGSIERQGDSRIFIAVWEPGTHQR